MSILFIRKATNSLRRLHWSKKRNIFEAARFGPSEYEVVTFRGSRLTITIELKLNEPRERRNHSKPYEDSQELSRLLLVFVRVSFVDRVFELFGFSTFFPFVAIITTLGQPAATSEYFPRTLPPV